MTICSTPGCGGDAVLQWQRVALAVEHDAYVAGVHSGAADAADAEMLSLALQVQQLQQLQASLPNTVEGNRVRDRAESQIAVAQRRIGDLSAANPPDPSGPSLVPVFGCTTHAPSPEAAAQVHDTSCCTSDAGCVCVLPPPPPPSSTGPNLSTTGGQ